VNNKQIRIVKEPQKLTEKVIEYFYNNPKTNSSKEMEQFFNVSHRRIRNIISKHLKEKLDNSLARRCAKH
tara:strand:+ start:524 stop:733 length:210 start_codon:yes stop_codon:yes gene_type:complete